MKNLTSVLVLFALDGALAFGQTATPSTTLCAATTATAKSVCLTAVTSVSNQTGLYLDGEYMVVNLSSAQTIAAGGMVPVIRGARAAGSGPASHANGTVVWLSLNPSDSKVPGNNGFLMGTNLGDVGTCVRASETYLPHIWPNRGVKRDCAASGVWVNYNELGDPANGGVQLLAASGAIPVSSGTYVVTLGSAAALTLAAPTAGVQDGTVLRIYSATAYAHTITLPSALFYGGVTTNMTVYTLAAYAGSGITLMAYNGHWVVLGTVTGSFTS
jgi:hypothetical protein